MSVHGANTCKDMKNASGKEKHLLTIAKVRKLCLTINLQIRPTNLRRN